MDELRAQFDRQRKGRIVHGPYATSGASSGFQYPNLHAASRQFGRRGQTRRAGADDADITVHMVSLRKQVAISSGRGIPLPPA